jgi:hypothetical protein
MAKKAKISMVMAFTCLSVSQIEARSLNRR